jgi:glycosyltransferase involved in cell wall biosynthesis
MIRKSGTSPDYSVVILCYETGDLIIQFVEKTIKSFFDNGIHDYELILVGNYWNNNTDKTPEIIQRLAETNPRIVAVTQLKQGMMGWDMKSGLTVAKGKYIAVIDGDGQMPAEDLTRVYKSIKRENLDLVKTVRTTRDDGKIRRIISVVFNLCFRTLYPNIESIDINSKPKILKRDSYKKLNLHSNDWFIDAEIMIQAKHLGFKVGEVPTHFSVQPRQGGSYINFLTIFEFLGNLIRYKYIELRHYRK